MGTHGGSSRGPGQLDGSLRPRVPSLWHVSSHTRWHVALASVRGSSFSRAHLPSAPLPQPTLRLLLPQTGLALASCRLLLPPPPSCRLPVFSLPPLRPTILRPHLPGRLLAEAPRSPPTRGPTRGGSAGSPTDRPGAGGVPRHRAAASLPRGTAGDGLPPGEPGRPTDPRAARRRRLRVVRVLAVLSLPSESGGGSGELVRLRVYRQPAAPEGADDRRTAAQAPCVGSHPGPAGPESDRERPRGVAPDVGRTMGASGVADRRSTATTTRRTRGPCAESQRRGRSGSRDHVTSSKERRTGEQSALPRQPDRSACCATVRRTIVGRRSRSASVGRARSSGRPSSSSGGTASSGGGSSVRARPRRWRRGCSRGPCRGRRSSGTTVPATAAAAGAVVVLLLAAGQDGRPGGSAERASVAPCVLRPERSTAATKEVRGLCLRPIRSC